MACALRLMDRDGAEALTFRAVARELDIAAGTLSNYFPNLAGLQDHVAAKVMSQLRPLEFRGKRELREQLVQLGMEVMETTQEHPYLAKLHGPESGAVITRMIARSVKALMQGGLDGERAMAVLSIVMSLAHAWGVRDAIPRSPELLARTAEVAREEFRGLPVVMPKLAASTPAALYRQWFRLCIDGMLP